MSKDTGGPSSRPQADDDTLSQTSSVDSDINPELSTDLGSMDGLIYNMADQLSESNLDTLPENERKYGYERIMRKVLEKHLNLVLHKFIVGFANANLLNAFSDVKGYLTAEESELLDKCIHMLGSYTGKDNPPLDYAEASACFELLNKVMKICKDNDKDNAVYYTTGQRALEAYEYIYTYDIPNLFQTLYNTAKLTEPEKIQEPQSPTPGRLSKVMDKLKNKFKGQPSAEDRTTKLAKLGRIERALVKIFANSLIEKCSEESEFQMRLLNARKPSEGADIFYDASDEMPNSANSVTTTQADDIDDEDDEFQDAVEEQPTPSYYEAAMSALTSGISTARTYVGDKLKSGSDYAGAASRMALSAASRMTTRAANTATSIFYIYRAVNEPENKFSLALKEITFDSLYDYAMTLLSIRGKLSPEQARAHGFGRLFEPEGIQFLHDLITKLGFTLDPNDRDLKNAVAVMIPSKEEVKNTFMKDQNEPHIQAADCLIHEWNRMKRNKRLDESLDYMHLMDANRMIFEELKYKARSEILMRTVKDAATPIGDNAFSSYFVNFLTDAKNYAINAKHLAQDYSKRLSSPNLKSTPVISRQLRFTAKSAEQSRASEDRKSSIESSSRIKPSEIALEVALSQWTKNVRQMLALIDTNGINLIENIQFNLEKSNPTKLARFKDLHQKVKLPGANKDEIKEFIDILYSETKKINDTISISKKMECYYILSMLDEARDAHKYTQLSYDFNEEFVNGFVPDNDEERTILESIKAETKQKAAKIIGDKFVTTQMKKFTRMKDSYQYFQTSTKLESGIDVSKADKDIFEKAYQYVDPIINFATAVVASKRKDIISYFPTFIQQQFSIPSYDKPPTEIEIKSFLNKCEKESYEKTFDAMIHWMQNMVSVLELNRECNLGDHQRIVQLIGKMAKSLGFEVTEPIKLENLKDLFEDTENIQAKKVNICMVNLNGNDPLAAVKQLVKDETENVFQNRDKTPYNASTYLLMLFSLNDVATASDKVRQQIYATSHLWKDFYKLVQNMTSKDTIEQAINWASPEVFRLSAQEIFKKGIFKSLDNKTEQMDDLSLSMNTVTMHAKPRTTTTYQRPPLSVNDATGQYQYHVQPVHSAAQTSEASPSVSFMVQQPPPILMAAPNHYSPNVTIVQQFVHALIIGGDILKTDQLDQKIKSLVDPTAAEKFRFKLGGLAGQSLHKNPQEDVNELIRLSDSIYIKPPSEKIQILHGFLLTLKEKYHVGDPANESKKTKMVDFIKGCEQSILNKSKEFGVNLDDKTCRKMLADLKATHNSSTLRN